MCGRFTSTATAAQIAGMFDARQDSPDIGPNFNVAPTSTIYAVIATNTGRVLVGLRWGLVPSWAKDPAIGAKMINARVETLREKPSFRNLLSKNRCVIPIQGFYEWSAPTQERQFKQPHYFSMANGNILALAGLWTNQTCTIITTPASPKIARFHHRMPLMLSETGVSSWLGADLIEAPETLADDQNIEVHPVSTRVNSIRNNDVSLISQVA